MARKNMCHVSPREQEPNSMDRAHDRTNDMTNGRTSTTIHSEANLRLMTR